MTDYILRFLTMNMDKEMVPNREHRFRIPPFKQPSRRCVYIIVAVCFLCILCIVLATTLSRKSDERCESSCTTHPCIKSAAFALSRIDVNKDPCEDFYEFACGKYEEEAVLFPDANDASLTHHEVENELLLQLKDIISSVPQKAEGTTTDILLLARKFYDDCMDTDHHPDILDRNALGKLIGQNGVLWRLLNYSNEDDLSKVMSTSIFYDVNPFFCLSSVGEWPKRGGDQDHQLIFQFSEVYLEQVTDLPMETPGRIDKNHVYYKYAVAIGRILNESGVNSTDVPNLSYEIRQFEKTFIKEAEKVLTSIEEKNFYPDDNPRWSKFDCQDLEKKMKRIKWCKIVKLLLEEIGRPPNSKVQLRFPNGMDYHETVNKIISQVEDRVVINYLVMKFIIAHLKYMPTPLRQLYYDNPEVFPGDNKFRALSSRWQQCVDIVSDFFWIPLEIEYMNEKLSETDKQKVTMLLEKVKEVYTSIVNRVPWIEEKWKKFLIQQMQGMKTTLGNSIMWESDGEGVYVIEEISNMTRLGGTALLKSPQQTLIQDVLEMKKLFRKNTSSAGSYSSWAFGNPFKTFSSRMGLHIRLPYGMLQFPMFLPGRPMYVEFGTLGRSALNAVFKNFILKTLSENTTKILHSTLECLNDQAPVNKAINGASKVHEIKRTYGNFHNSLSFLAATEAYLKYLKENGEEKGLPGLSLSNEQLFFVSAAQMNCEKFIGERYMHYPMEYFTPSRERVNLPLRNLEDFARVFRCSSDSEMNPKRKCCILGDGKLAETCQ